MSAKSFSLEVSKICHLGRVKQNCFDVMVMVTCSHVSRSLTACKKDELCFNMKFILQPLWSVLCGNPSPHTPILGSCNSAANKDMMSKILTNGHTIF